MTEQQRYEVIGRFEGFELRRYAGCCMAEVTVRGNFEDAGNRAFRALFGYINGDNRGRESVAMTAPVVQSPPKGQKVAMTAPVVQQLDNDAGEFVVGFVLPAGMTAQSAPVPTNREVTLRDVPSTVAAASAYSGRWSQGLFERQRRELMEAVQSAGLVTVGQPRFARFDPPMKPWFLRRNEVVVDVVGSDGAVNRSDS